MPCDIVTVLTEELKCWSILGRSRKIGRVSTVLPQAAILITRVLEQDDFDVPTSTYFTLRHWKTVVVGLAFARQT